LPIAICRGNISQYLGGKKKRPGRAPGRRSFQKRRRILLARFCARRNGMVMQHAELIRDWHPLDHTPPPDYVPPCWEPAWLVEWEDELARLEAEQEEKDRGHRMQNRIRSHPSSIEIAHMEAVIAWPARYLGQFPQLVRVVQCVALGRSRHRDMHWAARRLQLPGRLVRRWNREGLGTIALGLIRDRVSIF
jgi:hypothetical protein